MSSANTDGFTMTAATMQGGYISGSGVNAYVAPTIAGQYVLVVQEGTWYKMVLVSFYP